MRPKPRTSSQNCTEVHTDLTKRETWFNERRGNASWTSSITISLPLSQGVYIAFPFFQYSLLACDLVSLPFFVHESVLCCFYREGFPFYARFQPNLQANCLLGLRIQELSWKILPSIGQTVQLTDRKIHLREREMGSFCRVHCSNMISVTAPTSTHRLLQKTSFIFSIKSVLHHGYLQVQWTD